MDIDNIPLLFILKYIITWSLISAGCWTDLISTKSLLFLLFLPFLLSQVWPQLNQFYLQIVSGRGGDSKCGRSRRWVPCTPCRCLGPQQGGLPTGEAGDDVDENGLSTGDDNDVDRIFNRKCVLIAYDFYWEIVEYYSEYTAENTIFKCVKHCPRVLDQSFHGVRGLHLAWYTARELGLG